MVDLNSMVDMDSLSAAERRLVEAVKTGSQCDFAEGKMIQPGDMADWGEERTIRAAVLKSLLTGDAAHWGVESNAAQVALRCAVVSGDLSGFDKTELCLQMRECLFTGDARFDGVTFTGDARFDGVTFTGDARFDRATFTRGASLRGATFTRRASFYRATFARCAWFGGATFTGDASFDKATFIRGRILRGAAASFGGVPSAARPRSEA